ncbi:MAG: glycosyltransferase family 4 protein [Acidimicrobiales bacterium]
MDICVCGAQVPFTWGGAELHMENLVAALGRHHRAELVRLPVAWERERLFEAALAWRLVPLDGDLVIATNFPSYYVRHRRKVVWLFHQHRGAYDCADTAWSDIGLDDHSLEAQRLLADWDVRALEEAERIFTTSRTVADRLARFNGLRGEPLYHPPPLHDRLRPGPFGDYVLSASRLEHNKRPELLAEALACSTSGPRGVLAGRGSLAGELRARAEALGVAGRLEMPGHLSDDELVRRFSGALAVLYAPFDEDYGYVTLQAFYAAKPVITANDSGGVLEWVEDGETGLVTDGSPEATAAAIDKLAGDPALARRLGEAGRARVAEVSWDVVVERLVGG